MARLPTPGGDDNQWGTILNDFLGQSLTSAGALKNDIVTSSNVADGALPQAKITNLTTDLADKVDTTDYRLALDYVSTYPPQGYGFFTTSDIPSSCDTGTTLSGGTVTIVRVWIPANNAISSISAFVTATGTLSGGGTNGFAVYTDSGTLVTQTTTDNNLWTSTGWRTKTLGSPIAAQNTGRFVYIALLVVGYSGDPSIAWNESGTHNGAVVAGIGSSNRRSFYNGGQSSFPASFNPASYGTVNSYIPLVGLA